MKRFRFVLKIRQRLAGDKLKGCFWFYDSIFSTQRKKVLEIRSA